MSNELVYYPSLTRSFLMFLGAVGLTLGSLYYFLTVETDSIFNDIVLMIVSSILIIYLNRNNKLFDKMVTVIIIINTILIALFLLLDANLFGLIGLIFFGGGAILIGKDLFLRNPKLWLTKETIEYQEGLFRERTVQNIDNVSSFHIEKVSVPWLYALFITNEEFLKINLKSGKGSSIHLSDLNKPSSEIKNDLREFAKSYNIPFRE